MDRNGKGQFIKGKLPIKHKDGCMCFRCTHTSPMQGKKNPKARTNPQVFKKGQIPWNKGIPHSEEVIEKNRKAHLGKPNPNKGKRFPQYSGINHPNWKGGVTPLHNKIRSSIENKLWIQSVFARDGYTCQKTGIKGGKLIAHHILNFAQYPELRFAIDNGITLSVRSHNEFHKKYGKRNNTKEQVKEFLCQ